jgi:hypothetical protein
MKYTVVIDKAAPGTALGPEVTQLKAKIAAYAEALPSGLKVGDIVKNFDFTDDLKKKRRITFKVLKIAKGTKDDTIHIEITEFNTV